ncbi:hypothetical protein [Symmachiella macrocystis]|uniref:hypothetical protein n=1 Tax=Symmachiella macrocystis TaxID=2527985 RepID=UPI0011B5909B|nr:hypothetical protein [Symmachiella macrocystis]
MAMISSGSTSFSSNKPSRFGGVVAAEAVSDFATGAVSEVLVDFAAGLVDDFVAEAAADFESGFDAVFAGGFFLFAGALPVGAALIDEPQNGHSVASSSSTDWPQAGHVGKSIKIYSYLSSFKRPNGKPSARTDRPTAYIQDTFVMALLWSREVGSTSL